MSEGQNPVVADVAGDGAILQAPVRLRQAREAAGLHIAALAAALKVPVKKLEALEAGQYGELPDMTFARALASSACRHLKVDSGPVLEQIPLAHSPALGDSPQAINAPFKDGAGVAPNGTFSWVFRPAILAVVALLIAAVAVYFWPAGQGEPVVDAVLPPSDVAPPGEASAVPAGSVVESASPIAAPAVEATPPEAQPVPAAELPVASAPSVADSTPSVAPAVADPAGDSPASSLLRIAVSGDSWVEVVNGKGDVVVQRLLKAGDALDFSSAPPYSVVIGHAEVAQVSVRGEAFDVMPHARNSVARFEVK